MTVSALTVECDLPAVSSALTPRAAKALLRILQAAVRCQESRLCASGHSEGTDDGRLNASPATRVPLVRSRLVCSGSLGDPT